MGSRMFPDDGTRRSPGAVQLALITVRIVATLQTVETKPRLIYMAKSARGRGDQFALAMRWWHWAILSQTFWRPPPIFQLAM